MSKYDDMLAAAIAHEMQAYARASKGGMKGTAARMGRNYDTVRRWLIGQNPMNFQESSQIAAALGKPLSFFTLRAEESLPSRADVDQDEGREQR